MRFYNIAAKNKNFPYLLIVERGDNAYYDLKRDHREPYKVELWDWLNQNFGLRNKHWWAYFYGRNVVFGFNNITDAMVFKLGWL